MYVYFSEVEQNNFMVLKMIVVCPSPINSYEESIKM